MYNRINAIKSGNWSDPNTWFAGIFPNSEDEVYCNGNIINIDVNVEAKLITNLQTYPDTYKGYFTVEDNITIKSEINCGYEPLIKFSGNNLRILGDVYGSTYNSGFACIENFGTGTIEISGTIKGGNGGNAYGILNNNTGTINLTGNVYLGLGGYSYAIYNDNNGKIIINGIESTENGGYGGQPQY